MTRIIPIRDLKNTTQISELCNANDGPIFITKNGYEDMVIMSTQVYDRLSHSNAVTQYTLASRDLMVAENPAIAYEVSPKIYSLDEIKRTLTPIFKQFKVKKALLFGSYAKGNANLKSDIDICVDSGLKGLKFFGLLNDVTEALSVPVDLIDIQDIVPNSKVEKEIKKTGVIIYE